MSLCLCERLPECPKKRIRLLRTGQRDLVVDDEERNALDLKSPSQFAGLLDRLQAIVTAQDALGLVPVQPSFGNDVEERSAGR